jgi:hypothetical protein
VYRPYKGEFCRVAHWVVAKVRHQHEIVPFNNTQQHN